MKRIINLGICFMLGVFALSFTTLPSYAQMDEDFTTTTYDDFEWEYDWDTNFDSTTEFEGLEELVGAGLIFGSVMLIFALALSLGLYVYSSLAMMTIAKRLDQPNGWFAWIPILNVILLFKMGDMNPWLLLIALIPGLGAFVVGIISIIALMNICEKRGYEKLLGLLALVPLANLILLGILAWRNGSKKE